MHGWIPLTLPWSNTARVICVLLSQIARDCMQHTTLLQVTDSVDIFRKSGIKGHYWGTINSINADATKLVRAIDGR